MSDDGRFDNITENLRSFGSDADAGADAGADASADGGADARADDDADSGADSGAPAGAGAAAGAGADAGAGGPEPDAEFDLDDLDPEQRRQVEEAQAAMAEARERLMSVPAEVVITNHVMGLYELAAIHLSADEPDLAQAALAIDSVACLVDGLGDRLGPDAATMRDALNNIRLAFVQIKG